MNKKNYNQTILRERAQYLNFSSYEILSIKFIVQINLKSCKNIRAYTRSIDLIRMKQIQLPLDIMISHDCIQGIEPR